MSILFELPDIVERASEKCRNFLQKAEKNSENGIRQDCGINRDIPALPSCGKSRGMETCGGYFSVCDNAEFLAEKIVSGELKSAVDLIYIDPPFFSQTEQETRIEVKSAIYDEKVNARLSAYRDIWHHDMRTYLEMLAVRLMLMKKTLKPTGSIFVHLDWHAVHAVKLILDEIFGEENFVNEIIWTYKSGESSETSLFPKT